MEKLIATESNWGITQNLREQELFTWGTGEFTAGGNPAMDLHPIQGGKEILANFMKNISNV